MKIEEIMTPYVRCVQSDVTLVEAAVVMRDMDVGALPICEGGRLVGMLTDRDIALRAVAECRDPRWTMVKDVMSPGVVYIYADQEVEDAAELMERKQVRRLPVLNREKRLVGIVSLGDVAINTSNELSGEALKVMSQ
jgi:CBS domain-containing protein